MRVRDLLQLMLLAVFTLQGCGGGGGGGGSGNGSTGNGGLPPSIPTATVNGKAVDGLILNGTVTAYDYSKGTQGVVLGKATTDSNGNYSLTLQVESRAILLQVTGGYYVEEASGTAVNLQPDEFMTALVNFKTGTPITIAITPWTHVAAALANYNVGKGAVLSDAIDAANKEISGVLGLDITTTIPADVTDGSTQSAILSPAIQYGWMSAAISAWTYGAVPAGTKPHVEPYTSIRFAQSMYDDVLHDGVMDGVGTVSYLKFGTTPLISNVYRLGLAQAMLLFASNTHNKTGLNATQLLQAATKYGNNGDPIWGSALPAAFTPPTITISNLQNNTWLRQSINVQGVVADPSGIFGSTITVDKTTTNLGLTAISQGAITFLLDTTTLVDGPHNITINATDYAGQESTTTFNVNVDNTPPSLMMQTYFDALPTCYLTGTATDNLSGIATLTLTVSSSIPGTTANTITITPSRLTQNPLTFGFLNNPYDFMSSGALANGTPFTAWFEFDLMSGSFITAADAYTLAHPTNPLTAGVTAILTDVAGNSTTVKGVESFPLTGGCGGFSATP